MNLGLSDSSLKPLTSETFSKHSPVQSAEGRSPILVNVLYTGISTSAENSSHSSADEFVGGLKW